MFDHPLVKLINNSCSHQQKGHRKNPSKAFLSCKGIVINVSHSDIAVALFVSNFLKGWKRCMKRVRSFTGCSHPAGKEGYSAMPESVLL